MKKPFQTVGLIGKPHHEGANQTLLQLHKFLTQRGLNVVVEERVATELAITDVDAVDLVQLGERCDLAIVVGGDGNMLGAARVLSRFDVGVVGVNRGNLGFLTDLSPDEYEQPLTEILSGDYQLEQRYLLEAEVYRHGRLKSSNTAVNEAVLHPGKIAHMIDFEVLINDHFVFQQRSDGLIISTPTGSTAYSLSGGGPIMMPSLDALVLTPMFPHTLSARPIVVDGDSVITLRVSDGNEDNLQVSCDGHVTLSVMPGDEIKLRKHKAPLTLLHPNCYDYYEVLRTKLGWSSSLF
ncbi:MULTISPECIES: NAD(+) kinase [Corallincola]|uniref:NAD kinase n=3 Tax=Corallincola TaxID=1775176 RepID=A0A368NE46_9GAMM|nr:MULTISPECIES: NAD(+) kinase [Corallincola]RCU48768.1 NAD(+) kinase [Corallincola holothuriorum]TAA42665.1 NAD(+) kinase [Corallincola spongiicola]TCI01684.1 NAD(+) kinase [Corallincola luteus]